MKHKFLPLILYEDSHLLAINKPPRLASVPAENIPLSQTALGKIQHQFKERGIKPYILHRLDYQTSGVLLFGKHGRDRSELETIFQHPGTRKKYLALVKGVPKGKMIMHQLETRVSKEKISAKTSYKILKVFRRPICSLVEAEITTGRKHQIRKHFAAIGHPIVLDHNYGDPYFNRKFRLTFRLGRLFLHAVSFIFLHPFLKKPIEIHAPLALDLASVLRKL